MSKKLNVAVLKGGFSSERAVSLKSGAAVERGLLEAGHHVVSIDVKDTRIAELEAHDLDVAFIALHGAFGEDGGVQALLEAKGIAYTGSGIYSSKTCMNKLATKDTLVNNGIPTPSYAAIRAHDHMAKHWPWIEKVGLPLVVKPPCEGSSVGATIVRSEGALPSAMALCYQYDSVALLEKYIPGRELTVGILDNEPLPIVEIKPGDEFYSYEAKYSAPGTEYVLEPDLGYDLVMDIKMTALNAFWSVGCDGYARVDIMLGHDGVPYVLEINTIPGFTERSLLPKAAAHAGVTFPELCSRLAHMAVAKRRAVAAVA